MCVKLIASRLGGLIFHAWWRDTENCLLLQQEGVCGPLRHHCQDHKHQQPSVKREAISRKNDSFMVP